MNRNLGVCRKVPKSLGAKWKPHFGRWLLLALLSFSWFVPDTVTAQAKGSGGKPAKPDKHDTGKALARMMDRFRTKLEVANDQEWILIQQRLEQVLRAQHQVQNGAYTKKSGGGNSGGESNEARLRRLVDAKAPSKEVRAGVARLRDELRQRQRDLEAAQEDLRSILTPRQEAIALLNGWLR